jgi:sulfate permease, SulP family
VLDINAETVLETIVARVRAAPDVKLVVCGLSSSPFIDLAGAKMLHDLHSELASRGITFQIVGARGQVRDVLQADGLAEKTDSANWTRRMDSLLGDLKLS